MLLEQIKNQPKLLLPYYNTNRDYICVADCCKDGKESEGMMVKIIRVQTKYNYYIHKIEHAINKSK